MKASHAHQRPGLLDQNGFTLIEMLVVLAIAALIAGLAGVSLRRPQKLRLEAAAGAISSSLRLSRAYAIAQNSEVVFAIDADRRTFASPAAPEHQIEPDILVKLNFAATGQRGPIGAFRFFPDGTSSGGEIDLRLGNEKANIAIGWLTGEPHLNIVHVSQSQ